MSPFRNPIPQNGQGLPPGLAEAIRQAQQAPPPQPQAPSVPPADMGNGLLQPVEVSMDLEMVTITDPAKTVPATVSAVPGEIGRPDGTTEKVVIFTVRTVCQTFTALWSAATARANVTKLRNFISANAPVVILPPGLVNPDLRRILLTLDFEPKDTPSNGALTVELDSVHAGEWADRLEVAVTALSGLQTP